MISLLQAADCRVQPLIVASHRQSSHHSWQGPLLHPRPARCSHNNSQVRKLTTITTIIIATHLSLFFIMMDLMTNLFSWDLDFFLQSVFLR